MANYRISENTQYNSNEVYFESKPESEVLAALKALKLRWNPKKGCWYGFASQDEILTAIGSHDKDLGGVVSDGYMGSQRWDGNKSHLHLYGSDLSKAIREELKRQGVKGCSVSVKKYSGGQTVRVKVATTAADYVSKDDYVSAFSYSDIGYFLTTEEGEHISRERWFELDGDEQERTLRSHARRSYDDSFSHGCCINEHYIDSYGEYTEAFRDELHKINTVLDTYHYNDSNSMVDYFDTNFYRDIEVKGVA